MPSGEKQTLLTEEECPIKSFIDSSVYVFQFHIFMDLSLEPDANNFPSGEKQTLFTTPECPIKSFTNSLFYIFHNFMIVSQLPDAKS